jgi:hypothetical protein
VCVRRQGNKSKHPPRHEEQTHPAGVITGAGGAPGDRCMLVPEKGSIEWRARVDHRVCKRVRVRVHV